MDLFKIQLCLTWALCGLIWTIQLVHYPLFLYLNEETFKPIHQFHKFRILILVLPLMVSELLVGIFLLINFRNLFSTINLISIILIWLSTFLISVPIHNILGKGFNRKLIEKLVNTNWIRTALWTARALWLSLIWV